MKRWTKEEDNGMDEKEERLMEEANCEICKQEKSSEIINLGLDLGYHFGDYGKGEYVKYKVKPKCVAVTSFHLCMKCKAKIENENFFYIHILPQLKEVIKKELIKQMIIESFKENETNR